LSRSYRLMASNPSVKHHGAGQWGNTRTALTDGVGADMIRGMEMWNHPSCSKCAAARDGLAEVGVPYRIRPYLDQPPTVEELTDVLRRLDAQPWDVCRLGEPVATAYGMACWPRDEASVRRWIDAMVAAPELIQRPILLLDDGSGIIARTAEAVDEAIRRATR
jgi:arsenate reductase